MAGDGILEGSNDLEHIEGQALDDGAGPGGCGSRRERRKNRLRPIGITAGAGDRASGSASAFLPITAVPYGYGYPGYVYAPPVAYYAAPPAYYPPRTRYYSQSSITSSTKTTTHRKSSTKHHVAHKSTAVCPAPDAAPPQGGASSPVQQTNPSTESKY